MESGELKLCRRAVNLLNHEEKRLSVVIWEISSHIKGKLCRNVLLAFQRGVNWAAILK